ncbi:MULTISPECIES: hypothetical protein [Pseudomonas]|uniref:Uncharacterized protein n=1 Tax=Pseudomonas luteola TaxID=47886 RepID=A0ABS0MW69_PSELU|nr:MULTISPECIES: hypothetical protein [Pseudomonas]MBH3440967.1 hypothetical protein [Pseudomonas luteola]MDN3238012.1 hypothetical protein [Pseudomonas sp. WAC2]
MAIPITGASPTEVIERARQLGLSKWPIRAGRTKEGHWVHHYSITSDELIAHIDSLLVRQWKKNT